MKRELSYREEMVQQLQIVRGWSLSVLCASSDNYCNADVDRCSLSLWGKKIYIYIYFKNNQTQLTSFWTKDKKGKVTLAYWHNGDVLHAFFPVNSIYFSLAVQFIIRYQEVKPKTSLFLFAKVIFFQTMLWKIEWSDHYVVLYRLHAVDIN